MSSGRLANKFIYTSKNVRSISALTGLSGSAATTATWTAAAIDAGATHVFIMSDQTNQHLDQSGNGYDATPPTGTWPSRFGTDSPLSVEVDWSGTGDSFDITTGPLNENVFSVEAMFRTSSSSTTYLWGNDSGGGSTRPWTMAVTSAGELQAFANGQNGPVFTTTGQTLTDGAWHHAVFTHDWTSGHTNHYIDGNQVLTDGAGNTSKQTNGTMTFLGVRPAQGMWDGDMAVCAFYGGVELTPVQVAALYAETGI